MRCLPKPVRGTEESGLKPQTDQLRPCYFEPLWPLIPSASCEERAQWMWAAALRSNSCG